MARKPPEIGMVGNIAANGRPRRPTTPVVRMSSSGPQKQPAAVSATGRLLPIFDFAKSPRAFASSRVFSIVERLFDRGATPSPKRSIDTTRVRGEITPAAAPAAVRIEPSESRSSVMPGVSPACPALPEAVRTIGCTAASPVPASPPARSPAPEAARATGPPVAAPSPASPASPSAGASGAAGVAGVAGAAGAAGAASPVPSPSPSAGAAGASSPSASANAASTSAAWASAAVSSVCASAISARFAVSFSAVSGVRSPDLISASSARSASSLSCSSLTFTACPSWRC